MKDNQRLSKSIFKGLEVLANNISLEGDVLPYDVDIKSLDKSPVSYSEKYGFRVLSIWKNLYGLYNGDYSDKYIPRSLYYYYIAPYLYNLNMVSAYIDKNMYELHFPTVKQPKTIVKNINGRYYNTQGVEISLQLAAQTLKQNLPFIIKPAVESGCGRGVELIKDGNDEYIYSLLNNYDDNFITQECVKQHADMAVFNQSSLNTCRIYTFRPVDSMDYVILHAAIRFGGEGAFRDNASTGGGFCKINIETGEVYSRIFRYKCTDNQQCMEGRVIPGWHKIKEAVINMHKSMPYFDWIGWDIAVDEVGDPILIELNYIPDVELPQIMSGPVFGKYTDKLMERISKRVDKYFPVLQRSYSDRPMQNAYKFDILNERRL